MVIAEFARRRERGIPLLQRDDVRRAQIGERHDRHTGKPDDIARVLRTDPPAADHAQPHGICRRRHLHPFERMRYVRRVVTSRSGYGSRPAIAVKARPMRVLCY